MNSYHACKNEIARKVKSRNGEMRHWGDTHTMRTMKTWTIRGYLKNKKDIERVVKKSILIFAR